MDTAGQLSRFFVCVLIGIVGGVLYDLFSLPVPFGQVLKKRFQKGAQIIRFVADVGFFIAFAALCIVALNALCFPDFREYYYLGFAVGLILYLKTFHKAVAFFKIMCYNVVKKLVNCVKSRKNFRKKEEKRL
ncbi:MAG: spore cortex biosynthesis protein YabQ [Clostridia bacterium]|nr:spore cortex biosynthesis protein YabQ [Clostridia bacterium]